MCHVPRQVVSSVLHGVDPQRVQQRKRRRLHRRTQTCLGPNFSWHVDGYNKLKPYGFSVQGCIDELKLDAPASPCFGFFLGGLKSSGLLACRDRQKSRNAFDAFVHKQFAKTANSPNCFRCLHLPARHSALSIVL